MRLYNASSCTPVLAQTTNQLHQRQGPKTYLPKVAAPQSIKDRHQWEQVTWPHRRDDVDVDIEDCALDSPRAKSGASTTDIDKNFARNASALVQQVGLFPTRNSQNEGASPGNAKAVRILDKDDVRYFNDNDQDDGITIASSSTLSTHTTLQQSVVEQEPETTCSSSSATAKVASYGISSPFPTTAYQSMKSRHILSPARTGRVVTVEKQQEAKPVTSPQETIPQTTHCEVDDHPDDEDDSFKVVTSKESRSDLQTSSHFSSHVGFLRNIQGRLERCNIQDNRPSSRSSSMVNKDTEFRKIETSSSQEQNEYPCPQLSSTDCSSDESTWFDFSQQGSENPFHGPSSSTEEDSASSPSGNGGINKNQKNVHFTPIEKPPVSSRRRPLMTIKPRPTASRNNIQKQQSNNDVGIKDDIYHKNPKCFFPVKPQTRNFPTQSIKQRRRLVGASSAFPKGNMREPQEQDQQQRQPILLQGPRSDSAAMFPKAAIWNHHHHHFYEKVNGAGLSSTGIESISPDYSKYSAMFKSGITRDGVKQAMEEDGINQSIIDLVLQASTPRPSISTFQA